MLDINRAMSTWSNRSPSTALTTDDCRTITNDEVKKILDSLGIPFNEMDVLQLTVDILRFAVNPMNMEHADYDS